MKRILIVSHCILNTAAKVAATEESLQNEYKQRDNLIQQVLKKNIQLLQLPCPEFRLYGSRRWGHVKNQFQNPHFVRQSREMIDVVLDQVEEYLSQPDKFEIIGIVSVEGSPSCGYKKTCVGESGGSMFNNPRPMDEIMSTCHPSPEPGVFMEEMEKQLQNRSMTIPILTMEEATELIGSIL